MEQETFHKFMRLFSGLTRGYYKTILKDTFDDRGKRDSETSCKHESFGEKQFIDHLNGEYLIGVSPINENNKCMFCGIDVDNYDGNYQYILKNSEHMPIVWTQTKSNALHGYLFFKEEISADTILKKLWEIVDIIGIPKNDVEIFPKQQRLAKGVGIGNGLGLPFFSVMNEDKKCLWVKNDGTISDDIDEFVNYCESKKLSKRELEDISMYVPDDLVGAPYCLVKICSEGVAEGGRTDFMFSMGIFAIKRYFNKDDQERWKDVLFDINDKYCDPPLKRSEILNIISSIDGYRTSSDMSTASVEMFYKCNSSILSSYCNKTLCRKAKYGINHGNSLFRMDISRIVRIGNKHWLIELNDEQLYLDTTEKLHQQAKFQMACMEQLGWMPEYIENNKKSGYGWHKFLAELMSILEIEDIPEALTPEGQALEILEEWLDPNTWVMNEKDNILRGLPWKGEGKTHEGYFYFAARDFEKELKKNNVKLSKQDLNMFFKKHHAVANKTLNIRDDNGNTKSRSVYKFPDIFDHSDIELSIPNDTEDDGYAF